MAKKSKIKQRKFYDIHNMDKIPQLQKFSMDERFSMRVVANILPFRTNNYIIENLIDWKKAPDDPIFRMNFMHRDMLTPSQFATMANAVKRNASTAEIKKLVDGIRMKLNPHPAGQSTVNRPSLFGKPVSGAQHKYRETCLVFPAQGQSCFAYCTFCFRWPQFVDLNIHKFATDKTRRHLLYIRRHHEITDVLITGGDPMVMNARNLARYLIPLLSPKFAHIRNIRIGTKVFGHWPYRFLTDRDADQILLLFKKVVKSGKHLAFMAHFNHPVELSTKAVQDAIRRVRSTGVQIRTQAPVIRYINDSPEAWADLWRTQVTMGMVPYYMFIERDTGPRFYFEIPLHRILEIYRGAIQKVSGLARTVRGPSMSSFPGKVCIEGITHIKGEKVFVLNFLQGRNPDWVKRPFFAKYDSNAVWLNDLKPAFGEKKFFFEDELASQFQKKRPPLVLLAPDNYPQ